MPKLTRLEIEEALEEYRQSQAAIDQADPDFVEAAVYRQKAAECQLDALVRRAKVIPFPLARFEPEEPEQSWPEFISDLMEWPLTLSVGLLVVIVILVQFGIWLGWFH